MAHDEDHLLHDAMNQFGQAFAMGCLVVVKMRARRAAEDQRIQENVELHKEIERLQFELKHLNGLHQEAERLRAEKTKEAADQAQKAASLAEERNKLLAKVDKLKGELICKDEDLANAKMFPRQLLNKHQDSILLWTSQNSTWVKPWLMAN